MQHFIRRSSWFHQILLSTAQRLSTLWCPNGLSCGACVEKGAFERALVLREPLLLDVVEAVSLELRRFGGSLSIFGTVHPLVCVECVAAVDCGEFLTEVGMFWVMLEQE